MALARTAATLRPHVAGIASDDHERAQSPAQGTVVAAASHIRRCTFRRVTALPRGRRELPMYDVECLHPTYESAVPLGDLAAAYAACASCALPGIFRPDED